MRCLWQPLLYHSGTLQPRQPALRVIYYYMFYVSHCETTYYPSPVTRHPPPVYPLPGGWMHTTVAGRLGQICTTQVQPRQPAHNVVLLLIFVFYVTYCETTYYPLPATRHRDPSPTTHGYPISGVVCVQLCKWAPIVVGREGGGTSKEERI